MGSLSVQRERGNADGKDCAVISIVTWLWHTMGYRTEFAARHVNVLRKMITRTYRPVRFICVTNTPEGVDPEVEIVPDREDFKDVPSPHGNGNPTCYRRLRLFEPNAAETFGERIVSIDLDCVITNDMRPLFERTEDFVGWRDPLNANQICGSLFMLTAGSKPQVWDCFDPKTSPAQTLAAGKKGSDQAWISHLLPSCAMWGKEDGVYSWRRDCMNGLPPNARAVFFHGAKGKPWELLSVPWIAESYK